MNSTPPNRRRFFGMPLFRFLAFLGLGLLFPLLASPQLPVIRFARDPDPAPDFQLKDLAGKDLSLASAHGKVILLNFWATWCGPCRAEIPSLIELQNRYKEHLQIIGLADDDDQDVVKQVIDSEGINFPVAMVTGKIRFDYGGVSALPTAFVINTDGRIVQKHVGLFNPALYETEVRALLNLPIAAKVETFVDTGEIFLKHADRATMLPGVNLTKLTPEQRLVALHKFNAEECPCGCKLTLAQCRIYDHACSLSKDRTAAIVEEILAAGEKTKTELPAANSTPAPPESSKP
jgi:cytochrome c biogenesis protein CcmG, thiol:disulfide interchange protein DsbE